MNLNRAMIIGNITRDPELRTTTAGQTVANFGVATNHSWTDASGQRQDKAEFHNIVAWGKLAEICGQYLTKGRKVYVEGRLQTREWEGQDGAKRNRTEIIADNMIMLDRATGAVNNVQRSPAEAVAAPAVSAARSADQSEEIRVEDIPF